MKNKQVVLNSCAAANELLLLLIPVLVNGTWILNSNPL